MRGDNRGQAAMFSYFSPEQRFPGDYSLPEKSALSQMTTLTSWPAPVGGLISYANSDWNRYRSFRLLAILVSANWQHAPGRPTLLIYGHYDVQPPEPIEECLSPPFEPIVRGDALYGRGASNNKGQMFVQLKAIEAYPKTAGRLPVNVICLFEGEEEIGSTNLPSFLAANRRTLAVDCAVVSDTQIPASNRPAITYALRGRAQS